MHFSASRFAASIICAGILVLSQLFPAPAAGAEPCLADRFLPEPHSAGARAGTAVVFDDTRFAIGVPGRDVVWIGSVDVRSGTPRLDGELRGPTGTDFGASLAADGGLLIVGAPRSAPAGAAFVHPFAPGTGAPLATLRPSGATFEARVALSIAWVGDLVLLGAPNHGPIGAETGAVFPFLRTGAAWSALAPLLPFDGSSEGGFGEAVAAESRFIAISAPHGDGARPGTGVVFAFARTGGAIAPLVRIELIDGLADDGFGGALAFSGGDLAIGVPFRTATVPGAGVIAFVARDRLENLPVGAASLPIGPGRILARRESTVAAGLGAALVPSGELLIAGAPIDGAAAPLAGAVTIFARDPMGPIGWRELETVNPTPASAGSEFGRALAASASFLLVGAPGDPDRCGGVFGCGAGSSSLLVLGSSPDCDGDAIPDPCARRADPTLDLDGDGVLDRCRFRRGDLDFDGGLTIGDPLFWLLSPPGTTPGGACPAAADINDDGSLDLADPIALLSHLFAAGPPPPPPFPGCGVDGDSTGPPCAGPGCAP